MKLLCPRTASFDRKPIVGIASTHLFIIPLLAPTARQPERRGLPGLAGVCKYRADEPTIQTPFRSWRQPLSPSWRAPPI